MILSFQCYMIKIYLKTHINSHFKKISKYKNKQMSDYKFFQTGHSHKHKSIIFS